MINTTFSMFGGCAWLIIWLPLLGESKMNHIVRFPATVQFIIVQACSVLLASFCFCDFMDLDSISVHKQAK